jgi:hypothetical protein
MSAVGMSDFKEAAAKAVAADEAVSNKAAADEADKVHVKTVFRKGALASTRTASTRGILMPIIAFFNGTLFMCCVLMMLVVGNKLQIQSKDTLNQGCSMSTCHNRSMFDSSRELSARMLTRDNVLTKASGVGPIQCQAKDTSCIDTTTHVKLRSMGKSWFLDVNPGGVADKATADTACQASVIIDPGGVANKATAEAAGQASVIIDPGRVADTATADTAQAAEPAAAIIDPGGVAAKAAANTAEAEPAAAIIDPGGVTLCGGPVSRLGAHDHNVVFGMSATANSSIVKSITSTCADFVGADPTTIAVGAIRKASAIITVGSVAVAYADPSVPAVGTDTNAPLCPCCGSSKFCGSYVRKRKLN